MSGELKPCPFCGAAGQIVDEPRVPTMAMVMCGKDCELMPQTEWHEREEAIRRWNARTTPSQGLDAATVERCADMAFVAAMKAGRGLEQAQQDAAFVRRALATDPHQHGGKGA